MVEELRAVAGGSADVPVGLVDGPVDISRPALAGATIRGAAGPIAFEARDPRSVAARHGTFLAGLLVGDGSGVCPDCPLIVRPVFDQRPAATPAELAAGILACLDAGARVVNLSLNVTASAAEARLLRDALDAARRHGALVVAAAGNGGWIGASAVSAHPWVVPVVSYEGPGRPAADSNLGASIGRNGVGVTAEGGSSAAAALVSGALAALWSTFPRRSAEEVRLAVLLSTGPRRSVVPPVLAPAALQRALARSDEIGRAA